MFPISLEPGLLRLLEQTSLIDNLTSRNISVLIFLNPCLNVLVSCYREPLQQDGAH